MVDDEQQANRLESLALTLIFSIISVALLAAIGLATKWGPNSGGWWTRPPVAPGTALVLLVFANLVTLWRELLGLRTTPATADERIQAHAKILSWLRPIEFLGYFALYVFSLQHIGYFPATLLFILGLQFRVGLTSPKWLLTGFLAAVAMMAVFRMGLGVWMPAPELYNLFPNAIRTALIRWF
ncbi:MAG: tripartite tricarboxylate transporter TctB family protein [Paracoccaceae bacterium]